MEEAIKTQNIRYIFTLTIFFAVTSHRFVAWIQSFIAWTRYWLHKGLWITSKPLIQHYFNVWLSLRLTSALVTSRSSTFPISGCSTHAASVLSTLDRLVQGDAPSIYTKHQTLAEFSFIVLDVGPSLCKPQVYVSALLQADNIFQISHILIDH